jgi:hypothetical protein
MKEKADLYTSAKMIAALLAPKDATTASGPIKSFFHPEKLVSGESQAKNTAKHVMDLLTDPIKDTRSLADILNHSVKALREMGQRVRSIKNELDKA